MKLDFVRKNLTRRPGRSAGLMLLAALLSFSMLCGTLFLGALQNGLSSLQDRLGADIMVVPYEATTKTNLSNILLQGSTGYFYMDAGKLADIAERPGVGQISAQFFLASTSSGCCSIPVQIIGIDPTTDFTITPWLKKSGGNGMRDMEVFVGNDLNAFVGDTLTFYGTDVTVAGKLEKTGTALDTAVYTNKDTVLSLIRSSLDLNMNDFAKIDPERVISCVLVNVADGYNVEEVANDINIHVRKVEAIQTKNMISGVAESLTGISDIIGVLMAVLWIFSIVIMVIAFSVSVRERKKEFAVLRSIGASQRKLSNLVMSEGLLLGLIGGVIGAGLALLFLVPFRSFLETALNLPFLLPGAGIIFVASLLSILLATFAGGLSCMAVSRRTVKSDTGLLLRESA